MYTGRSSANVGRLYSARSGTRARFHLAVVGESLLLRAEQIMRSRVQLGSVCDSASCES